MPDTNINPFYRMAAMTVVALLVILPATLNYKYWAGQAPTPDLSYLMGIASFLVDLVKPMTPFFLAAAIANNKPASILAAMLLLLTCVVFSMASAIGLSSIARFDGGTVRQAKADTYSNLQQERKRIVAAIDSSSTNRTSEEITAQMQAVLAEPIKRRRKSYGTVGGRSKQCAKPDRRSREGCARYAVLAAEQVAAKAKQENHKRLAIIDQALNAQQSKGLVSGNDPQAHVFAAMLGIKNIDMVRNALVILFAWTLEYVGLVVPYLLYRSDKRPPPTEKQPTVLNKPEPTKPPVTPLLKPVSANSTTIH